MPCWRLPNKSLGEERRLRACVGWGRACGRQHEQQALPRPIERPVAAGAEQAVLQVHHRPPPAGAVRAAAAAAAGSAAAMRRGAAVGHPEEAQDVPVARGDKVLL